MVLVREVFRPVTARPQCEHGGGGCGTQLGNTFRRFAIEQPPQVATFPRLALRADLSLAAEGRIRDRQLRSIARVERACLECLELASKSGESSRCSGKYGVRTHDSGAPERYAFVYFERAEVEKSLQRIVETHACVLFAPQHAQQTLRDLGRGAPAQRLDPGNVGRRQLSFFVLRHEQILERSDAGKLLAQAPLSGGTRLERFGVPGDVWNIGDRRR